jgi:hypothetical protein
MSLLKFKDALLEHIPDLDNTNVVFKFLQEYIENEQKIYKANKKDNKLTFGKFSGYTIKEVASSEKGKSYLEWLMAQSWFVPDKFPEHYEELKRLKIKKKPRQILD